MFYSRKRRPSAEIEFKAMVRIGSFCHSASASDEEVLAWFNQHGTAKTPAEVKAWSDGVDAYYPHENPDQREWFDGECTKLGLDPVKSTLTDFLDADDRVSFKN